MVFKGYWGHPEATRAAFVEIDGKPFFRTGDLGRRDEEGYFFLTDRLKRMINASGFKVWPSEVELLLFKCPLVQEACVIGSARRLPRRNREGRDRAARRGSRHRHRAGHHRLGARAHGRVQGAAASWSSSTRCRAAARAR